MGVNLNNLYHHSLSFLEEKFSFLTPQNKKILLVALACLGAIYFVARRLTFVHIRATHLSDQENKPKLNKEKSIKENHLPKVASKTPKQQPITEDIGSKNPPEEITEPPKEELIKKEPPSEKEVESLNSPKEAPKSDPIKQELPSQEVVEPKNDPNPKEVLAKEKLLQELHLESADHFFDIFKSWEAAHTHFELLMTNGFGKITRPDGKVEEGQFQKAQLVTSQNELNGHAISIDSETIRVGNFQKGKLNGSGKLFNGAGKQCGIDYVVSEGEYEDDLMKEGTITFPNGSYKKGIFGKHGYLNGQGEQNNPTVFEKGIFQTGHLHGQGIRRSVEGRLEDGQFRYGKLEGSGKIYFKEMLIQDGDFERGYLKNGTYFGENEVLKGEFLMEGDPLSKGFIPKLHGPNGMINEKSSGRVIQGHFQKGMLHGQGKITYPDGRVEEGEFRNGQLILKKA